MRVTINQVEENKHSLSLLPSGHGHYKISCYWRGKRYSTITNNMPAVDDYKSDIGEIREGSNRMKQGYISLIEEIKRNNNLN